MGRKTGIEWSKGVGPRFNIESEETNKKIGIDIKEKCSLCGKMFKKKPFERNMFCWAMRHTETTTYEKPSWICPECKNQLNLFMTKVLMDKKDWEVKK